MPGQFRPRRTATGTALMPQVAQSLRQTKIRRDWTREEMIRRWLQEWPSSSDYWLRNARIPAAMLRTPVGRPDVEGNTALDLLIKSDRIAVIEAIGSVPSSSVVPE